MPAFNATANIKKVVVLGEPGVGKTKYVERCLLGIASNTPYLATLGVEVHPFHKIVNGQLIHYNVWDIAGNDTFAGNRDSYLIGTTYALIMHDPAHTPDRWIQLCHTKNIPYTLISPTLTGLIMM